MGEADEVADRVSVTLWLADNVSVILLEGDTEGNNVSATLGLGDSISMTLSLLVPVVGEGE